jgi:hypothetical protein
VEKDERISIYPRFDKNVGFWLVDDPLVQNPCYRLVVT